MKEIKVSGGGRFYYPNGTPCNTIIGKNGKERSVNVGDAKKLGLLPSVTTVMGILEKSPNLQKWIIGQYLLSAVTLPKLENEVADVYVSRVIKEVDEEKARTMQKGTDFHSVCETYIKTKEKTIDYPELFTFLDKLELEGEAERRLTGEKYAGKVDFIGKANLNDVLQDVIIDFKSQTIREDGPLFYNDWVNQLAAYALLSKKKCKLVSIIIGTNKNMVEMKVWDDDWFYLGATIFLKVLDSYRMIKGFDKPDRDFIDKLLEVK